MRTRNMTRHAQVRMQQRGISPLILEWLVTYGARTHDQHGGMVCYFDRNARRRLGRAVGARVVDLLGELLTSYAVLDGDGAVITAGHRFKRINIQ